VVEAADLGVAPAVDPGVVEEEVDRLAAEALGQRLDVLGVVDVEGVDVEIPFSFLRSSARVGLRQPAWTVQPSAR
jgi:hypothetical protein